jgi:hypothetical protein
MNKTIKAIGLVLLGLIIESTFTYIAIAFVKAEANPFAWTQEARAGMLAFILIYFGFVPLMLSEANQKLS